MVIQIRKNSDEKKVESLINRIESSGLKVEKVQGFGSDCLSVIGDLTKIDLDFVKSFDIVENVKRLSEPFSLVSRKNHPLDTVIDINGIKVGNGNFSFIAGPCAVESEKQIIETAKSLKECGVKLLRGGAFKPRTSPYSFQGLGEKGIKLLLKAKAETGMSIVSEIVSERDIDLFFGVDVLQIGARNMQNFSLIKQVAKTKKPILLKRGLSATVEEWLLSAEYLLAEGATDVILCERGIRSYEPSTRATLDLSSLPFVKECTHLPIIVDPSHASGSSKYVKPLALAAVAAGADGLMIEVHNDKTSALSDGVQAVTTDEFKEISIATSKILAAIEK